MNKMAGLDFLVKPSAEAEKSLFDVDKPEKKPYKKLTDKEKNAAKVPADLQSWIFNPKLASHFSQGVSTNDVANVVNRV